MKRGLVLVLLLCLGIVGWKVSERLLAEGESVGAAREKRPVTVLLAASEVRTLRHVAEFTGTLEASARFVVAPKVGGRLEKLRADIGDRIENGSLVAELDSLEYQQAAREAEAELEVARAGLVEATSDLTVAERELSRASKLRAQNAVSQSELDDAQAKADAASARLTVAEAQVRQQEAALSAARVRLAYTRVEARWDGEDAARVVGERFVDEGDTIESGDAIVSVVDLDPLTAVINVIERDFPHVRVGQEARILADAYPGRTFSGRVARLAPVLQETSRQARVEIAVPNAETLLAPGMFVRVDLTFATRADVLAVPADALARHGETQGVYLAHLPAEGAEGPATASYVSFTPGIREAGWVEVSGEAAELLAGGRVVTLGKHLLTDGAAIRTAPERGAAPKAN